MDDIISRIEHRARENADRIAFMSRAGRITYKQLWERSGNLAGWINLRMGDNKDPVIVYGHKDPMMLVCFLACVRSGRAYCPLDSGLPPDRIRAVREMIGDPLLLMAQSSEAGPADPEEPVEQNRVETGTEVSYEMLCGITKGDRCFLDLEKCLGEDVFYMIFTSGSTGNPKGVQITEHNLRCWMDWALTLDDGIRQNRVFLNQAPYSFDLSVMDLYLSLVTGGTIVSVDKDLQENLSLLTGYLNESNIEYWVSTPSFAELCLSEPAFAFENMTKLRTFLFCGEVLAAETAQRLMERFPQAHIINTYGPTEATVCVTQVRITEAMAKAGQPLPVGRPGPDTKIRIDPYTSEIIIEGGSVSPGYYEEPQRTAAVFSTGEGGMRGYRTGDRGHLDDTGMLYCEGRMDHQIKLHGYRIELEDVEANIEKLDGIARAVVIPLLTEERVDSLTAYIVREGDEISDDYQGRKAVRAGLKQLLPAYMIPKRIRFLEKLPITANGKIDRKQLHRQENSVTSGAQKMAGAGEAM